MRGSVPAWPEAPDARRRLVDSVEDVLAFGGTRYRFVRLASAGAVDVRAASAMDPAACALFAWCQNTPIHGDTTLDAMLTPRVTAELYHALADRARQLAAQGAVPRTWADPRELPWPELLRSIIACIAAGASDPTAPRRGIATLVPRVARELRDRFDDLRATPALALRMLRPDDRPRTCRHYSVALPVIFAAVQRAAGRDEPVFAIELFGRPSFSSQGRHGWNWFVDAVRAQIVAIDLHTALKDRTADHDVFSTWLDWITLNNVSAFLNALFYRVAWGHGGAAVRAAMPRLINPATLRGQCLLYRLAQQPAVHPRCLARIVHGLERRGLAAAIPDWRRDIERALTRVVRAAFRVILTDGADAQCALLDAIDL